MSNKTIVVTGLGNPGEEFKNTPHNSGFRVVDKILKDLRSKTDLKPEELLLREIFNEPVWLHVRDRNLSGWYSCQEWTYGTLDNKVEVYFLTPLLFMNLSGHGIEKFLIVEGPRLNLTKDMLVIHDDLDIPMGEALFRASGGPGNNNGCKDIDSTLNLNGKWNRIKVGTGTHFKIYDKVGYVLAPIAESNKDRMADGESSAAKIALRWITQNYIEGNKPNDESSS